MSGLANVAGYTEECDPTPYLANHVAQAITVAASQSVRICMI